MATTKRRARSGALEVADLVREAIDEGAKTVEEIHKSIAALPLDVIGRIDGFEKSLKDMRRIQENSIGAVYDVIRRVNDEVNGLAKQMLGRSRASKPAPARKRTARKKTPARRPAAHA